jgi:hypothetical protein
MTSHAFHPSRRAALASTLAAFAAAPALLRSGPALAAATSGPNSSLPVGAINAIFGAEGTVEPGGVLRFDFDRSDLSGTKIMGVPVDPGAGFDTEIAFQPLAEGGALVKWEVCVLDTEVNPLIDAMIQAHLTPDSSSVTAIHNHLLLPTPQVKFVHGTAIGAPGKIAEAWRDAVRSSTAQPFHIAPPQDTGLPNGEITTILGGMKEITGQILNVSVDRLDRTHELGVKVLPATLTDHKFTFQATGGGQAIVNAEYVLLSEEVDPVARVLRTEGISLMALHNHELFAQPDYWYLHAFAQDDPIKLARQLRRALNRTNSEHGGG